MIQSLCCCLCGSFGISGGMFPMFLMLLLLTSGDVDFAFFGVFVHWVGSMPISLAACACLP
jgi:hypothetical protein